MSHWETLGTYDNYLINDTFYEPLRHVNYVVK